jgi:uncharacterized membrane protein
MQTARPFSLFIAISFFAMLIGAIMYSHMVYMPAYLLHLPESNRLITGESGIHDEYFWMRIHPVTILSLVVCLVLNWKLKARRKFIVITLVIYITVLVVTFLYFVPELQAFAKADPAVTVEEWSRRGHQWQYLSWIRGCCMYTGFVLLLVALTKGNTK